MSQIPSVDAESVASNRWAPTDLFNTKTNRKSLRDTNGLVTEGSPTLKSVLVKTNNVISKINSQGREIFNYGMKVMVESRVDRWE